MPALNEDWEKAKRGEGMIVTGKRCGEFEYLSDADLIKIYPPRILTRAEFNKKMELSYPGKYLP